MNRYFGLALLLCCRWSLSHAGNRQIYAVGGTASGQPCVFPFKYNSKWYLDCTSDNESEGRLWCAITADYDADKKWGYCTHNLIYAEDGNDDGRPCVFPFKFNSKWYSDCTTEGTSDKRLWCATTADYDKDKKWGLCSSNLTYSVGGNSNGQPCFFPFKYDSKWQSRCINDGISNKRFWCATTADYKKDEKWGYCPQIYAVDGNADGQSCVFPFKYNSKWYLDCTSDGKSDGSLWCATTADYDKDQKWGYCSCNLMHTVGGTAKGQPCSFPFKYKSKSYSNCTSDGTSEGRLWCATTADYEKDKKWGYCSCNVIHTVGGKADGDPCVFPFKSGSKLYSNCTSDGTSDGRLWCATTADYDKDQKWGYCAPKLIYAVGGRANGEPCVFPFKFNSKWHSECISHELSEGRLWCATTIDYDKDTKWGYCTQKLIHTESGKPCVFPFKFNSKWYSDCTSDGLSNRRPWCAISSDYEKDKKWGYCIQANGTTANS